MYFSFSEMLFLSRLVYLEKLTLCCTRLVLKWFEIFRSFIYVIYSVYIYTYVLVLPWYIIMHVYPGQTPLQSQSACKSHPGGGGCYINKALQQHHERLHNNEKAWRINKQFKHQSQHALQQVFKVRIHEPKAMQNSFLLGSEQVYRLIIYVWSCQSM